jgi:2OG-Fe(II) oxygenase superfamily
MNGNVVAPGIMLFTDVWDNAADVVSQIEAIATHTSGAVSWKRALVHPTSNTNIKSDVRTNSNLSLDSTWKNTKNEAMNMAGELCDRIVEKVYEGLNEYGKKFYPNVKPVPQYMVVLKYQTGQEYKQHVDAGNNNNRMVSMVMYLNDEYEGGNIEFPFMHFDLKPPANSMIFFPSNYAYAHIAHPVKTGTKYAVVQWIEEKHEV